MTLATFAAAGAPVKTFGGTIAAVPVAGSSSAGDIVIVAIGKELVANVTGLPSGFQEIGTPVNTTTNVIQHHLFGKICSGTDAGTYDFTWTGSAPYIEGVACRWSTGGVATGAFFEAATGAQRSSAGTVTPAVSLTTLGTDRTIVWSGYNYNGGAWTPPGSYTERYDGGTTLTVASRDQAAAGGTGSITGTCGASDYETARMVAIFITASTFSVAPTMMPLLFD